MPNPDNLEEIHKALETLNEITTSVLRAGYNCTCAYTPDNVSVDKDWLEHRLREARKALLLGLQPIDKD